MTQSALLAAAAVFGLATVVSAQAPTARNADNANNEYRVKQIIGAKVTLQGDVQAGTVEDIVIGEDGQVDYLVVSHNNKFVAVPWEAANFNAQQKTATVNITQETFKTVPTFTAESYPQFYAPEYRTQIYKAYNLTPRQIRKINRR